MTDALPLPSTPANAPCPPFYTVNGIANLRDIGGYACLPSDTQIQQSQPPSRKHSIRQHLLYRSADPSRVTDKGVKELKDLGVRYVFDLRSAPEVKKEGVDEGSEGGQAAFDRGAERDGQETGSRIQRIWSPCFAEQDYSPEKIAVRYRQYAGMGSEVSWAMTSFFLGEVVSCTRRR